MPDAASAATCVHKQARYSGALRKGRNYKVQISSAPLHTAHDILRPVPHVLCMRVLFAGQQNKRLSGGGAVHTAVLLRAVIT